MDGVLIVDKPKGLTSHDVVDFIRKNFRIKKVGHAGSLDPIATGVLVILIGTATKYSNQLMSDDKAYEATLEFGVRTDTYDARGKVVEKKDIKGLNEERIKKAFLKYQGEQLQAPPSFSAVKHKGTPLYKLARRGISIEKEPRRINIKELTITKINLPYVSFKMSCTKGTYVRRLCDDIGEELDCGAHMTELTRVGSGEFKIENSLTLDELKKMDGNQLEKKLIKAS